MAIITGTNGNDAGFQALVGGQYADTINGLAGDDEIFGLGGNDILVGGLGNDGINGGADLDLVSYDYAASSVTVDLDQGYGFVSPGDYDQLAAVENVWGTAFGDIIVGDDGANEIFGRDGSDFLSGGGGADRLSGGDGIDLVSYFLSGSAVQVNLGTGTVSGGDAQGDRLSGVEVLVGSTLGDKFVGDGGDNWLNGGGGNDTLRGGAGTDFVSGDAGKDALWGGADADHFHFGHGDSADTKGNADVINDYSEIQGDKIGLTDFSELDFIGTDAFTAADQVRIAKSGGDTFVALNLDSDTTAEMWIKLEGNHSLEANDFLL